MQANMTKPSGSEARNATSHMAKRGLCCELIGHRCRCFGGDGVGGGGQLNANPMMYAQLRPAQHNHSNDDGDDDISDALHYTRLCQVSHHLGILGKHNPRGHACV